jgi:hypothetical protein
MDHRQARTPDPGLNVLGLGVPGIPKNKLRHLIYGEPLDARRDLAGHRLFMLHLAEPECGPIGLEALLVAREVIELLVRTAEYHESVIEQSRYLRLDPENMIRVRLA